MYVVMVHRIAGSGSTTIGMLCYLCNVDIGW